MCLFDIHLTHKGSQKEALNELNTMRTASFCFK